MTNLKIDAVVVTFNPSKEQLFETLGSIANQVRTIFVIDNSTKILKNTTKEITKLFANSKYYWMGHNVGIAKAQNIGIDKAQKDKADLILMSDQDSHFPPNYVMKLIQAMDEDNSDIAAPSILNINDKNRVQSFYAGDSLLPRTIVPSGNKPLKVYQVISSGMMVKNRVFSASGKMNSRLFIDWVDFEFCWRARTQGFTIKAYPSIRLEHKLANGMFRFAFFNLKTPTPFRAYFIVRNGIYLSTRNKTGDCVYSLFFLGKSLFYFLAYVSCLSKAHSRRAIKGLIDGISGKLGS